MPKRRSDGRLQKSITIIESGKKKRKYFYGQTNREINQKIITYSERVEKGKLFLEVVEEWQDEHCKTIGINTFYRSYNAPIVKAIEYFGRMYIKEITTPNINNFIYEISKLGKAYKTVSNYKLVLNLIFNYAVIRGYISSNPVSIVNIPKNLFKGKRCFPTEDEIEVVKQSYDKTFGLFFYLILYTGLRRGEALALTYEDINFEDKIISINKSVFHYNNKPVVKSPKTDAGHRSVLLMDCLANKLQKNQSGIIFGNNPNTYLTESQFNSSVNKYHMETGLSITAHQLRHAYATILYEAGIPDKDAQQLMGHAQISTTKDIYTHISERQQTKTFETLNSFVTKFDSN